MSETELQFLDLIVFSNYGDGRNDTLAVMKIAYESGARNAERDIQPHSFDEWVKDVKKQLNK